MTGLEVAAESGRDASRQRRRDERSAAALEAANRRIQEQEKEMQDEQEILAANWVADTQLQFSQLSYNDLEADNQQPTDHLQPSPSHPQSLSPLPPSSWSPKSDLSDSNDLPGSESKSDRNAAPRQLNVRRLDLW
jgi:hypothetical protein